MKQQVHFSGAHALERLITVFDHTFSEYHTQLVAGGDEPVYLPVGPMGEPAKIIFTRDYFASALHEIAHWCVAGSERRKQKDYGYWYVPDGRSPEQQKKFERVEVKPQALEWIFSVASQQRFHVSADNVDGDIGASDGFKRAVWQQALHYCRAGLPRRANEFADALRREFHFPADPLLDHHYSLDAI